MSRFSVGISSGIYFNRHIVLSTKLASEKSCLWNVLGPTCYQILASFVQHYSTVSKAISLLPSLGII